MPCFIRWPGRIPAGKTFNGIVSAEDWLPTLLAAAGDADIAGKLRKGHAAGANTFKVHLDGYTQLPYLSGQVAESPRNEFIYVNDDAQLVAIRSGDWKTVFMEQRAKQCMVWSEPFVELRIPKLFSLRQDPFERADENANTYQDWWMHNAFLLLHSRDVAGTFLATFREFPPRQKPESFNLDAIIRKMQEPPTSQ